VDKLAAGALVEVPLHLHDRRYIALHHGDRHRGRAELALLGMMRPAPALARDRAPRR
jgi:hypothetical protein